MARRRRRTHRRRRRRDSVSESIAVYSSYHDLDVTLPSGSDVGVTKLVTQQLTGIVNEGTTNRKLVGVTGELAYASTVTDASLVAMIALIVAPELDTIPPVTEWDPFASGPNTPGSTSYKGRPSPRPFGRKLLAFANDNNSAIQQFATQRYRTRAKRLIRPGWDLHLALWAKSNAPAATFRVGGVLNLVVEG